MSIGYCDNSLDGQVKPGPGGLIQDSLDGQVKPGSGGLIQDSLDGQVKPGPGGSIQANFSPNSICSSSSSSGCASACSTPSSGCASARITPSSGCTSPFSAEQQILLVYPDEVCVKPFYAPCIIVQHVPDSAVHVGQTPVQHVVPQTGVHPEGGSKNAKRCKKYRASRLGFQNF